MIDLSFKLEQSKFEGPMDLLLHLIDKNKMDIMDIPIAELTDQYFDYLEEMRKRDENTLDSMSDFLVMAATLLDIKARLLLPPEKDEQGEDIDPRSELVMKLIEYKMYKYMSYELKDREEEAAMALFHLPSIPKEVKNYREEVDLDDLLKDVTLGRLRAVFLDVMKRMDDRTDPVRGSFGRIEREKVNAREVMTGIQRRIRRKGKCTFRSLLTARAGRDYVVVTFLTVLELMKMGRVDAVQEEPFGEIMITAKDPGSWGTEFENLDLEYEG